MNQKPASKKQQAEALRLRVKPGDSVSISVRVENTSAGAQSASPKSTQPGFFARAAAAVRAFFQRPKVSAFCKKAFSPMGLFVIGCALFTLTRFIRLPDFPLSFSSDEALTALRGLDLVRDGGFDYGHYFLPPLFINDGRYSLGTTVYLQIIPLLLFGKSVWVVRGVSALVSLLGVIWFSLILRDIFKLRLWWAGAFLLGVTPAWFLFSRAAYETAQMTALYAGLLYYYLRYRTDQPKYLYAAAVFAAMAFYAYQPGQVTVSLTLLAFGLVDIRYHLRNWKISLPALGVLFLLALPMAAFVHAHPEIYAGAMGQFGSYLGQNLTAAAKAQIYIGNYLQGLSPTTWYWPGVKDEPYYLMKGYGHILAIFLPLAVWGIIRLFKRRQKIEIIAVLVPFFAAPAAAAMIGIQVTRILVEIIPYSLVTMLGIEAAADWLEKHRLKREWVTAGIVILLSVGQIYMLTDALTRGPTWWKDYGITGIQWGSNQVFKEAIAYSNEHPDTKVYISGGWIFKADSQQLFFVPKDTPVQLGAPADLADQIAQGEDLTFVVTPDEFQKLQSSGIYDSIQVEKVIPYPDGTPGFRFIKLAFTPQKEHDLQEGISKESEPVTTTVQWEGQTLAVTHAPLSAGKIDNLFDGDFGTFIRSLNVNPLWMDYTFPQVTSLTGVQVRVGSEPIAVTVTINGSDPAAKKVFTQDGPQTTDYKEVTVDFGSTQDVKTIEVDVKNKLSDENGLVHIWELAFLQPK